MDGFRPTYGPIFLPKASKASLPKTERWFYCPTCKYSFSMKTGYTKHKCLACGTEYRYLGKEDVGAQMAASLRHCIKSRHVAPNRLVMKLAANSPEVHKERMRVQELKRKAMQKTRKR